MSKHIQASVDQSYAFVFVCQQHALEGMALLLAASLKRFLKCTYELIAAIPLPEKTWGKPSVKTLKILQKMGVRVEYIENPIIIQKKGDQLTNKIYCLQIPTQMDKLVFLDSDLLCLQEFGHEPRFRNQFNAAPTFRATGRNWEKVYQIFGLSSPQNTMKTLFSNELQPPYFNSGFVAVNADLAQDLYQEWLNCFHQIDRSNVMQDNPYFREQVSLSVAVIKMGLSYDVLDQNYNYWVKYEPLKESSLPYFLHHTWPYPPTYDQPFLKHLIRSLVDEYPGIYEFVARCRWKYYLRSDWLVSINRSAFDNRKVLQRWLGESWTHALIQGHF
ncbi:MAG: hypothetical protein AAF215_18900 [Cyanobacteria bacterium P01_A01_bin.123]